MEDTGFLRLKGMPITKVLRLAGVKTKQEGKHLSFIFPDQAVIKVQLDASGLVQRQLLGKLAAEFDLTFEEFVVPVFTSAQFFASWVNRDYAAVQADLPEPVIEMVDFQEALKLHYTEKAIGGVNITEDWQKAAISGILPGGIFLEDCYYPPSTNLTPVVKERLRACLRVVTSCTERDAYDLFLALQGAPGQEPDKMKLMPAKEGKTPLELETRPTGVPIVPGLITGDFKPPKDAPVEKFRELAIGHAAALHQMVKGDNRDKKYIAQYTSMQAETDALGFFDHRLQTVAGILKQPVVKGAVTLSLATLFEQPVPSVIDRLFSALRAQPLFSDFPDGAIYLMAGGVFHLRRSQLRCNCVEGMHDCCLFSYQK